MLFLCSKNYTILLTYLDTPLLYKYLSILSSVYFF
nr:MAG TPA: hypothetical protein [Caudoviricetes sp.]